MSEMSIHWGAVHGLTLVSEHLSMLLFETSYVPADPRNVLLKHLEKRDVLRHITRGIIRGLVLALSFRAPALASLNTVSYHTQNSSGPWPS